MPFGCGQTGWLASTWDAHVPSVYNIDFNRSPDDGQPVRASESGVIASPAYTGSSSNPVGIDHDGGGIRSGWATLYLHMRNTVPNGTRVNKGDVIGYVSNVGAPGGIHLHYEQRLNWVSQPVTFSNWSAPYNAAMKTGPRCRCAGESELLRLRPHRRPGPRSSSTSRRSSTPDSPRGGTWRVHIRARRGTCGSS